MLITYSHQQAPILSFFIALQPWYHFSIPTLRQFSEYERHVSYAMVRKWGEEDMETSGR